MFSEDGEYVEWIQPVVFEGPVEGWLNSVGECTNFERPENGLNLQNNKIRFRMAPCRKRRARHSETNVKTGEIIVDEKFENSRKVDTAVAGATVYYGVSSKRMLATYIFSLWRIFFGPKKKTLSKSLRDTHDNGKENREGHDDTLLAFSLNFYTLRNPNDFLV